MKALIFVILFLPTIALATEYNFAFTYQGGTLKYKTEQRTWEAAFKLAAQKCFDFYTEGSYPGEEKGLDIIDVCANPKEIKVQK